MSEGTNDSGPQMSRRRFLKMGLTGAAAAALTAAGTGVVTSAKVAGEVVGKIEGNEPSPILDRIDFMFNLETKDQDSYLKRIEDIIEVSKDKQNHPRTPVNIILSFDDKSSGSNFENIQIKLGADEIKAEIQASSLNDPIELTDTNEILSKIKNHNLPLAGISIDFHYSEPTYKINDTEMIDVRRKYMQIYFDTNVPMGNQQIDVAIGKDYTDLIYSFTVEGYNKFKSDFGEFADPMVVPYSQPAQTMERYLTRYVKKDEGSWILDTDKAQKTDTAHNLPPSSVTKEEYQKAVDRFGKERVY